MKKLYYGDIEIYLDEDTDAQDLRNKIEVILAGQSRGPWLHVQANSTTHTLLVTPGIPIRFEDYDSSVGATFL